MLPFRGTGLGSDQRPGLPFGASAPDGRAGAVASNAAGDFAARTINRLAGAVIVTFFIQLAIQRKEGFVVRAMASVTGAIVVLAIASAVFALIG